MLSSALVGYLDAPVSVGPVSLEMIARDFALGDDCLPDMPKQPHRATMVATKVAKMLVPAALASIALLTVALAFGCANDAIEANRRQVEANQALIEQTQRELARLHAEQSPAPPPPPVPGVPSNSFGACDKNVEATATRRAGDAYAAGNTTKALGYYQDAMTACPSSSKAALNLAHVNETMDNRDAAIRYYRAAAASNDSDARGAQDAKAALSRLGVN